MSQERHAIEALRAGVPNRAAIRLLGTMEHEFSERFVANLRECRTRASQSGPGKGQIIAGGFGAGKSHLLGYLQELALQDDFIVSRVSISKETPLFDAGKLLVAAMRNAVVPKRNDDAMTAVLARLRPESDEYDELEHWVSNPSNGLSPLFAALLHLIPRQQTSPENVQQIGRFFEAGKISLAQVRQWLRATGAHKLFNVKPVKAPELTRQRLKFVPQLMKAAGYGGWCILLDEVELIGRYSVLQRGRSYAELARWLGLDLEYGLPGIVSVAAVTDDFKDRVIGDKRDDELVPAKLLEKGERENASLATSGIRALSTNGEITLLRAPDEAALESSLEKIRSFYEKSYAWMPPHTPIGESRTSKSMRQYIKSWITSWDLQRLYGVKSEIVLDTVFTVYSEDKNFEHFSEPDEDSEDARA